LFEDEKQLSQATQPGNTLVLLLMSLLMCWCDHVSLCVGL